MKSKEEIEQLAEEFLTFHQDGSKVYHIKIREAIEFAYTQCQEDMIELLKEEIRRAYIHGQGNGQMMEVGLERDEVDDYTNSRMLSLNKD
jgi:hypothetical protein